jgi:Flp pilus assembly protein TadG
MRPSGAFTVRLSFVPRLFRRFRHETGQAALEFMLVIPGIIALILLMIDLGLMTYSYIAVANSVREAARFGSVNCGGTCSEGLVQARAVDRSGGILKSTAGITVRWQDVVSDGITAGRGDAVVVSVTTPYEFLFFPGSINVKACSSMRIEQQERGTGLPSGGGC